MLFMIRWVFRKKIASIASKCAMESCETIITEMGAEIHDDLIQRLSILKLRIDRLQLEHGDASESLTNAIQQLQFDYKSITDSVRRISKQLHPTRIDGETFDKPVLALCQNIEGTSLSRINFTVIGDPKRLSSQPEIYLLRMIQELIHNSLKHSTAWHLWIRLIWHPNQLIIEVEDDGTGFAKTKDFISLLRNKNNTLRMRAVAIGAEIKYKKGQNGLLATITYNIPFLNA
jgi:signal transduction histidine kinase